MNVGQFQLSFISLKFYIFTFKNSPDKLDPNSRAFEKLKNAKKFDPKRSSVLEVLNDQLEKKFNVADSETKNDTARKI